MSPNYTTENLLGISGKINKEDLIREEKFIKESRKWKRNTSDTQNVAPLAQKIVKASTLLNENIPKTSFTVPGKTAKVAEESKKTANRIT